MVLTLAAYFDLELYQINIKGAYLNGKLNNKETIYMCQLPGYTNPALPCHICHLCKTLYRLRQSSHWWYQKLVKILVKILRFKLFEVNQAVFIKRSEKTLASSLYTSTTAPLLCPPYLWLLNSRCKSNITSRSWISASCTGYSVLKSHGTARSRQFLSCSDPT